MTAGEKKKREGGMALPRGAGGPKRAAEFCPLLKTATGGWAYNKGPK